MELPADLVVVGRRTVVDILDCLGYSNFDSEAGCNSCHPEVADSTN